MKIRTAKLSQGEFTSPLSDNFKRKMLQGFPLRCRFGRRRGQGPGGLRGPPGPLQPLPPAWPTRAARPVLRELPSLRSGDLPPRRAIALRLQRGRGGMGAAQTPGGVKPLWPQGSEYLITCDKPTKTIIFRKVTCYKYKITLSTDGERNDPDAAPRVLTLPRRRRYMLRHAY